MTTELLLLLLESLKLLRGQLLLLLRLLSKPWLLLRLLGKPWLLLSKLLLLLLRTLLTILRSLRIREGLESLISELIFLFDSEPLSGGKDKLAVAKLVWSLKMGKKSSTGKGRDEGRRGRGCGGSGGWGRSGFSYNLNDLFSNDNLLFRFFFLGNCCDGLQNNFLDNIERFQNDFFDDIERFFWNSGSSFFWNGCCGNSFNYWRGGSGKNGDIS